MSRMLSRGLMNQNEYNALQSIDQTAGAPNACLEWITIRAYKGIEQGGLKDEIPMKNILFAKFDSNELVFCSIKNIAHFLN